MDDVDKKAIQILLQYCGCEGCVVTLFYTKLKSEGFEAQHIIDKFLQDGTMRLDGSSGTLRPNPKLWK